MCTYSFCLCVRNHTRTGECCYAVAASKKDPCAVKRGFCYAVHVAILSRVRHSKILPPAPAYSGQETIAATGQNYSRDIKASHAYDQWDGRRTVNLYTQKMQKYDIPAQKRASWVVHLGGRYATHVVNALKLNNTI